MLTIGLDGMLVGIKLIMYAVLILFCDKDYTCFATASLLMIERSKDLDLCLFKTDIFWCGILASRLALMESLCGLRLNVVSAKVPRAIPVVSKSSATKVSLQFRD